MEPKNAFIGHLEIPLEREVSEALGATNPLWTSLLSMLAAQLPITSQEWKSSSPKLGWALRLLHKKRNLIYLSPCTGCFRVALVLGKKAVAAAHAATLPPAIQKALAEAPVYPEGTGLRLIVREETDLAPILVLARIKLEN